MSEPAQQALYRLLTKIREANQLARHFSGVGEVFPEISVEPPSRTTPAELGFLRTVSWSFALFHEAGRASIRLLEGFAKSARPTDAKDLGKHLVLVNELRTFLQHDLDRTSVRNTSIDARCAAWFKEACGTTVPSTEEEWESCLSAFLIHLESALNLIVQLVRDIERNTAVDEIVRAWAMRKKRAWSPEEFDPLIAGIAGDLGRTALDVVRFRKRYADRWIRSLELLTDGSDIQSEVRKLIEFALISDEARTLPISGEDLMREFSLPAGPAVGALLKEAKLLYEASPCHAAELFDRLRRLPRAVEILSG